MKKVLAKVTNVLVICYDYSIIEEYEENVIKSKKITIKDKLRKRERREIFMLSLESDYTKGAHKKILERLCEINMEPQPGYGSDMYCEQAGEKIKAACGCHDADVFFMTGGTQTNALIIDSMTEPYEGVVAADSGHVSVHEAGAVEFTGHKVLTIPGNCGKIQADRLRNCLEDFWKDENHEHMVFPGMVYLSHPTEFGTLYSLKELEEISGICREYQIPLYLDGARLGYGLMSQDTNVSLEDIARLCDVFYIGGTKVGALFGEAAVFTKKNTPKHFVTRIKQHGALLAKGWLTGVQFDVLFTDGLYFEISKKAVDLAQKMKEGFAQRGYEFFIDSPTNQQFIVLENGEMEQLRKKVRFSFWEKIDDSHAAVRIATSWATKESEIRELFKILDEVRS